MEACIDFNTGDSQLKVEDGVRMTVMAAVGDDPDGSGDQIVFGGNTHATVENIDGINVAIRVEPTFCTYSWPARQIHWKVRNDRRKHD
jgi:hypothetical protein